MPRRSTACRIDDLEVFPGFLAGRTNRYRARYDHTVLRLVDEETGGAISFDFDTDYPQPLLVHHACGDGTLSIGALSRMRASEDVANLPRERLAVIGRHYVALHIRNTDYRTEYEEWLTQNPGKFVSPVFVATDNRATVAHCRSTLGAKRCIRLRSSTPRPGSPFTLLPIERTPTGGTATRYSTS